MDEDQGQAQGQADCGKMIAGVGAVREDDPQEAVERLQLGQNEDGAIAVLDVGRMNRDRQEKSKRVDRDMALAPLHLLAGVGPADPPFSVAFTLRLSMIAAAGLASLPSCPRISITR